MTLVLSISERLARARADLRMGLPVLLKNPGAYALVAAIETVNGTRLDEIRQLGKTTLAITKHRADTLKVPSYDGDIARISIPTDAGLDWLTAVADPSGDLLAPLKGPLTALRDGDATLPRAAITMVKEARLLPAVLTTSIEAAKYQALANNLTAIDLDLAAGQLGTTSDLHAIVSAKVPLKVSEAAKLHVFRPEDGGEEHYAIEIGRPDRKTPVLTRLHSACFTGDLLGSLKCDCGPQLHAALTSLGNEGAGILLYLNQEGRGIGLANKMRAYSLQDQGFDTVEANHRLGFEDDERDFRIGAAILTKLGFSSVRLLTNNPAKVEMLQAYGITVAERVPLKVGLNPLNAKYLDTKAKKSGHIL